MSRPQDRRAPRRTGSPLASLALWALATITLGALVLGAGKILITKVSGPRGEAAVPVALASVRPHTFTDRIEAVANARSNEQITLTAKITETVRRVAFTDGQTVKAGDILVELTNAEQSANLQAAQTAHDEADKNFQRITQLAVGGYASAAQLDAARTARDNAQGKADALASQLADRLIRAPFDGILGLRYVSPGGLVRPGDVITTLDDVSSIKLDFAVPEVYIASVRAGLAVEGHTSAYPDRLFSGAIEAIDGRVDPVTRTIVARAALPNPDNILRAGMLLSVDIIRSTKSAPAVPERAIVALRDQLFAFKAEAGKSARVLVKTGAHGDGYVEITQGLALNDRVIVDGVQRLRDGQKLDIVEIDGQEQKSPQPRPGS